MTVFPSELAVVFFGGSQTWTPLRVPHLHYILDHNRTIDGVKGSCLTILPATAEIADPERIEAEADQLAAQLVKAGCAPVLVITNGKIKVAA